MYSAMISFAPAIASSTVATSFSSEIYSTAACSNGISNFCNITSAANGSKPFSFAMVALVLLFGRYGRYKSSTTTKVSAAKICAFNSSVRFPCSSMVASTCSFFSSKFLKYCNLSYNLRSCSSLSAPVASFRYLEINGIVFPSSIN